MNKKNLGCVVTFLKKIFKIKKIQFSPFWEKIKFKTNNFQEGKKLNREFNSQKKHDTPKSEVKVSYRKSSIFDKRKNQNVIKKEMTCSASAWDDSNTPYCSTAVSESLISCSRQISPKATSKRHKKITEL